MRPASVAIVAIVLASFASGCSKNQPTAIDTAAAVVEFESVSSSAASAVVYPSLRVDTSSPPDGSADITVSAIGRTPQPVCETGPDVPSVPVAWPYALEVSVVRDGTTVASIVETTIGPTGRFEFSKATSGDLSATPLPDRPIDPPQPTLGGLAVAYTDGVETTNRSRLFLVACQSADPSAIPEYRPTSLTLERGDLLKVSARRGGSGFGGSPTPPSEFRGTLFIDGRAVPVTGTTSAVAPASGFAFTFQLQ